MGGFVLLRNNKVGLRLRPLIWSLNRNKSTSARKSPEQLNICQTCDVRQRPPRFDYSNTPAVTINNIVAGGKTLVECFCDNEGYKAVVSKRNILFFIYVSLREDFFRFSLVQEDCFNQLSPQTLKKDFQTTYYIL